MPTPVSHDDVVGVGVRTVLVGGMPLLLAGVPSEGVTAELLATVAEAGLTPLTAVTGVDLPRGAALGFAVDTSELRLVDATDATAAAGAAGGLDAGWLEAARRMRGTMTVVVRDGVVDADSTAAELAARSTCRGRRARAGPIVGFVEERPTLPLLFWLGARGRSRSPGGRPATTAPPPRAVAAAATPSSTSGAPIANAAGGQLVEQQPRQQAGADRFGRARRSTPPWRDVGEQGVEHRVAEQLRAERRCPSDRQPGHRRVLEQRHAQHEAGDQQRRGRAAVDAQE